MKHKILITAALLFFSACMKVKKKEDDAQPVVAQAQQLTAPEIMPFINTRAELDYKYEVSETTDFHKVHFFAPENWSSEVIVKKLKGTEKSEGVASFNEQAEWTDSLIPGEKITYQFYAIVEKEERLLAEADVLPVLDLKIEDEDVNLMQLYKLTRKTKVIQIRNLEVQSQKRLFIEDFNGTIIIDHLKTNNGFIQTFPVDKRAADDAVGKSGGQVNLVINEGEGHLVVLMKGQNGGNGSPAKEPDANLDGAKADRSSGADFSEINTTENIGSAGQIFSFLRTTYECKTPPGLPTNGNPGLRGYPGHAGKNGGDSGSAKIISLDNNVNIDLHASLGFGGKLTIGSSGGIGSAAGDIADGNIEDLFFWFKKTNPAQMLNTTLDSFKNNSVIMITKPCSKGSPGIPGRPGEPGLPGASNGEDGIKQPSYINSEKQP